MGLHQRHQRHTFVESVGGNTMKTTKQRPRRKPQRATSSYERWLAKAMQDFRKSERYKEIQEAQQIQQQELEIVREMKQWL